MSDEIIKELVERIHLELEEIPRVLTRMEDGWARARSSGDDLCLDGVALNLHGFDIGTERVLARIAETINRKLPHGEGWDRFLQEP